MPVYQLMDEMTHEEFIHWLAYFEQRPVGWRDDNRFMKILQAIGIKAKPEEVFMSLATMKSNEPKRPVAGIQNSMLMQLMLQSADGDQPDFLKDL